MALQYPLLFPFGEDGYRTNTSFADHYKNTITKGARLYQQFWVDDFANIEDEILDYIRMNQNNLQSDLYHNINELCLKEICNDNLQIHSHAIQTDLKSKESSIKARLINMKTNLI
uniref:Uncharacterized protein n=1 Tax=Salix viminalis TaxID=40686 RepID=A0A6N2KNJ4_SALVM